MRWHLRLIVLCTVAALAAGCSNSDRPSEPTVSALRAIATDLPPNTACMGDSIWSDTNCDGIKDPSEHGLGGVTVRLYECPSNTLVDETVSEPNGYYALFGPAPDDYYIVVLLPEGCRFSPKDVGQPAGVRDIGTDSDVDENGVGFCTNLSDQEIEKDMDAGICCDNEPCTADVGDRVWIDANCNGVQDKEEPNVPGITVTLYTCAGVLVGTTTTGGAGDYLFTGVENGSYYVCFSLPTGYEFAPKDQGGVEGLDSDVNANGCTDCFTIADCKDNLFVDAGLCRHAEGEGCTPGFWKNHLTHWGPTGFSPDDIFDEVFGCEIFGDDTTLYEAASPEITHNTLAAHGVAALLNASHPGVNFGLSVGEVFDAVCRGDKDTLSTENERGCPLSGGNTNKKGGGPKSQRR